MVQPIVKTGNLINIGDVKSKIVEITKDGIVVIRNGIVLNISKAAVEQIIFNK